jgi:hypothetical protein
MGMRRRGISESGGEEGQINVDILEENYLLQFCLGQLRQGEKLDSIVASEICESRMKIYKSSYPDSYNWAILKGLK